MRYTAPASTYGSIATYTTGSTYSCCIDTLAGNESLIAKKKCADSTHFIGCDYGATVDEKDRIVIDNITYDVLFVDNPMSLDHHLEIEVKRRDG